MVCFLSIVATFRGGSFSSLFVCMHLRGILALSLCSAMALSGLWSTFVFSAVPVVWAIGVYSLPPRQYHIIVIHHLRSWAERPSYIIYFRGSGWRIFVRRIGGGESVARMCYMSSSILR